jgi:hypothetical protein
VPKALFMILGVFCIKMTIENDTRGWIMTALSGVGMLIKIVSTASFNSDLTFLSAGSLFSRRCINLHRFGC